MFNGKRAVGVEYIHKATKKTVLASKEVIVSAGTVGSPQLLMLSGIGPKKELNKQGVRESSYPKDFVWTLQHQRS